MVTVVKHEWHQHDRQYSLEFDEALLSEIYPEMENDEIDALLKEIENGEVDIEEVINDAYDNDVDLDWDFGYDDCWTDRKGGYDVTYEIDNDYEGETPPEELPKTHKCTKCRWQGRGYETLTQHLREDGSVIEDYWSSDEEAHTDKEVCPMCDSDIELTEAGIEEERERAERQARWDLEAEEEEENHNAECTVCEWGGPESDTLTIEGVMCCPDCREPVFTSEQVAEQRTLELNEALEELKQEFEKLMSDTHKCTECEWQGTEDECEKEGICPNCCAHIEKIDNE